MTSKRLLEKTEILGLANAYTAEGITYDLESKSFYYCLGSYKFDNCIFLMMKNRVEDEAIKSIILSAADKCTKTVYELTLSDFPIVTYQNEHFYEFDCEDESEVKEKITSILGDAQLYTNGYIDIYSQRKELEDGDVASNVVIRTSRVGHAALGVHSGILMQFNDKTLSFFAESPTYKSYHNHETQLKAVSDAVESVAAETMNLENVKAKFIEFVNNDKKFEEVVSKIFGKRNYAALVDEYAENIDLFIQLMTHTAVEEFDKRETMQQEIYKIITKK